MIQLATEIAVNMLMVWTTVSTTHPASMASGGDAVYAVYRPVICNQTGTEYKVTTGTTVYNGKSVTFELGREVTGISSRSIDCNNSALVVP